MSNTKCLLRSGGGTDTMLDDAPEFDEDFAYWAEWVDAVFRWPRRSHHSRPMKLPNHPYPWDSGGLCKPQ